MQVLGYTKTEAKNCFCDMILKIYSRFAKKKSGTVWSSEPLWLGTRGTVEWNLRCCSGRILKETAKDRKI